MAVYASHTYWRVRFLAGQGTSYALRNLQFRRFADADPVTSCGTVEECRAGVEPDLLYNEQAEGTRAVDLFLYNGGSAFDAGWASLEHPEGLPDTVYVGRHYPDGRDVSYIGLIAVAGTQISKFAVEYSDDGENWTLVREFTTDPEWSAGETRTFALPNLDSYLPVFSFRANRKEPMSERVEFLTDVLRGARGAEQRRSLRPTPRRSFEGDFLLSGRERTFWDLFFNKLAGGEMMIPLYWEGVLLEEPLWSTTSTRINFETYRREWKYMESGLAILMGKTALDYEVVQITGVDLGGIDLAYPVANTWPRWTKLYPLRRGVIEGLGTPSHPTAGLAKVSAQFRLTAPNPWEVPESDIEYGRMAVEDMPEYEGLPVFLDEPNWVEELTIEFGREVAIADTGMGLPFQVDTLGRALMGQAHRWFLPGRERLADFRDLIYKFKGRAKAFWLPTFKADLKLTAPVAAGATQITVENVGYRYTGGPTSGREHIAIKHEGGTILRKVVSVLPGLTTATERLILDSPIGLDLSPGQVRRISFADTARFDSDEFEIIHHGGIDGHHEATAMFRTFRNSRTAPLPIHYPILAGQWTSRAICFVIDRSLSMDEGVPGGGTRMSVTKAAMSMVMDAMKPYAEAFTLDVCAVSFSNSPKSITRRAVTDTGLDEIKTWINNIATDGGGTYFDSGMEGAEDFFAATSEELDSRYLFFLTDGEATSNSATEAGELLQTFVPIPRTYGISIDLANTSSLEHVDNTPEDGIPVVTSSNVSSLADAVLGALNGVY